MKLRYAAAITGVFALGAFFIYMLLASPLGENSRLSNAIQSAALFVALAAAITALAAADPIRARIKVDITPSIEAANLISHTKGDIPKEFADQLSHLPEQFVSRRISFAITNKSGFPIENPVLSFRLPLDKLHPHIIGGRRLLTFNSNLFNSQADLRLLDFGDTRILSNSNLPYWNDRETITIWIRMALPPGVFQTFVVVVSLNGPNAQGAVNRVTIAPALLENAAPS